MKVALIAFLTVIFAQDLTIEKAKKTLDKTPDDPTANLTLAVHYAEKAKWEVALSHFEKVKNADIRAAVEAEKKADGGQFTSVEIGDAWSKVMPKAGPARQACFDRMNFHYAAAWPGLEGLGRDKLKERLSRLYLPVAPGRNGDVPKGWGGPIDGKSKAGVLTGRVRSGGAALRLSPSGNGLSSVLRVEMNLPKGKTVEFSGWVATDGTDTTKDSIKFMLLNVDRKPVREKTFLFRPDSPVWARLGDEGDFPDGAFSLNIEVILGSAKGFIWFDDLSVKVDGKEVLKGGNFE